MIAEVVKLPADAPFDAATQQGLERIDRLRRDGLGLRRLRYRFGYRVI